MPEYDGLSDVRNEWWLAVEVYSCLDCGALVTDKAMHDYWHNPTPRYVTDEDRNPDEDYEPMEWECVDCGRKEVSQNVTGWTIGHEGTRCPGCAANRRLTLERDHYRDALEAIDQAQLGTGNFAMRVIAQQAIVAHDPEYPNNRREQH